MPDRETNFVDVVKVVEAVSNEVDSLRREIDLLEHVLTRDINAHSLPLKDSIASNECPSPLNPEVAIIPFLHGRTQSILEKVTNSKLAVANLKRIMNGNNPNTQKEVACVG